MVVILMEEYPIYKIIETPRAKLTIGYDEYPSNPRENDNLGKMVCFHSKYSLGDKHYFDEPDRFIEDISGIEEETYSDEEYKNWHNKVMSKIDKEYFILPLYLYDHSGITMNTGGFNCPWDSGQVGYIYVSKAQIREEWKVKRISPKLSKTIYAVLEDEVKIYDHYLTGEVFYYNVEPLFPFSFDEDEDSCHGFYGSDFKTNGMADYLPEFKDLLEAI